MENIVLIGFMGCGKSTIAKHFQNAYGMEVVEMDEEIVRREGMSIADIFAVKGEPYFRDLETKLLIELQDQKNTVISCGGGAALREQNVAEMKKNGIVVLLTASPETIFDRVKNNTERPILNGNMNLEYIQNLMEQRKDKYEAAADLIVQTDGKSVEGICGEIRKAMTLR